MDPDDPSFEQAMRGVVPLSERGELSQLHRRKRKTAPVQRPAATPAFALEQWGEQVEAVAKGVDRALLAALRRGEFAPERELDLHGHTESSAARLVASALTQARATGERCLLVIHGRGRRSAAEPTLKAAVVRWLSTTPLSASVLVFTTAPPALGGPGAMLVLLRKG